MNLRHLLSQPDDLRVRARMIRRVKQTRALVRRVGSLDRWVSLKAFLVEIRSEVLGAERSFQLVLGYLKEQPWQSLTVLALTLTYPRYACIAVRPV